MTTAANLSLALSGLWLTLALLILILPAPRRRQAARLLTLAGVPVLGWLTLHWGPEFGIPALVLGTGLLLLGLRQRRLPPAAPHAAE